MNEPRVVHNINILQATFDNESDKVAYLASKDIITVEDILGVNLSGEESMERTLRAIYWLQDNNIDASKLSSPEMDAGRKILVKKEICANNASNTDLTFLGGRRIEAVTITETTTTPSAFNEPLIEEVKDVQRWLFEGQEYTLKQLLSEYYSDIFRCHDKMKPVITHPNMEYVSQAQELRDQYYFMEMHSPLKSDIPPDEADEIVKLIKASGRRAQVEDVVIRYQDHEFHNQSGMPATYGVQRLIEYWLPKPTGNRKLWCYSVVRDSGVITRKQEDHTWEGLQAELEKYMDHEDAEEVYRHMSFFDRAYITLPPTYRAEISSYVEARRNKNNEGIEIEFPFSGQINTDGEDHSFTISIADDCDFIRIGSHRGAANIKKSVGATKTYGKYSDFPREGEFTAKELLTTYNFSRENLNNWGKLGIICISGKRRQSYLWRWANSPDFE